MVVVCIIGLELHRPLLLTCSLLILLQVIVGRSEVAVVCWDIAIERNCPPKWLDALREVV